MTKKIQTPRIAKGKRPQYFSDPSLDQMHAMIIALTTEVSVLTDRADLIERLLEQKGTLTRRDIEDWQPDANALTERHDKRETLIRRIFRSVHETSNVLNESADKVEVNNE